MRFSTLAMFLLLASVQLASAETITLSAEAKRAVKILAASQNVTAAAYLDSFVAEQVEAQLKARAEQVLQSVGARDLRRRPDAEVAEAVKPTPTPVPTPEPTPTPTP